MNESKHYVHLHLHNCKYFDHFILLDVLVLFIFKMNMYGL